MTYWCAGNDFSLHLEYEDESFVCTIIRPEHAAIPRGIRDLVKSVPSNDPCAVMLSAAVAVYQEMQRDSQRPT